MDGARFDRLGQALGKRTKTLRPLGAMLGFALAGLRSTTSTAQNDIATAGSGGFATASSNGGAIGIGDINSGGNVGNAVAVGNTYGSVWVDGGDVANSTSIGVSADGGTAIADASGGSYNTAFVS